MNGVCRLPCLDDVLRRLRPATVASSRVSAIMVAIEIVLVRSSNHLLFLFTCRLHMKVLIHFQ